MPSSSDVKNVMISLSAGTLTFTVTFPVTESLKLTDSASSLGSYSLRGGSFFGLSEKQSRDAVKALFRYEVEISGSSAFVGTGATISCAGSSVKIVLKGDLDGDGEVTVNDYQLMKSSFKSEIFKLKNEYAEASDINGDGKMTVSDYLKVKRHVSGSFSLYRTY